MRLLVVAVVAGAVLEVLLLPHFRKPPKIDATLVTGTVSIGTSTSTATSPYVISVNPPQVVGQTIDSNGHVHNWCVDAGTAGPARPCN